MAYAYHFRQMCDIQRVDPAATSTGDPYLHVTDTLPCTFPYPASQADRERAGQGSFHRLLVVYAAVPVGGHQLIKTNDRLLIEDHDMRIHSVLPWPEVRPKYLKLLVDQEAG